MDVHGNVLFLGVCVVLVHVEHDDRVRQREGRVSVVERLVVGFLQNTTHRRARLERSGKGQKSKHIPA